MKIRYRWKGQPDQGPMIGGVLRGARGGYLITALKLKQRDTDQLCLIEAERVPLDQVIEPWWPIVWDKRQPRRRNYSLTASS